MKRQAIKFNKLSLLGVLATSCLGYLAFISPHESVEAAKSVATHIGTFEGSTTFTTSSRNGINPGLFIEVMDDEGNLTQYESEEGIITIPNTKEGAYVTQAKLLGKTKYVDEETGEILDQFEEGRNLRLESVQMPVLTTSSHKDIIRDNLFYSVTDDGVAALDKEGDYSNFTFSSQIRYAGLAFSFFREDIGFNEIVVEFDGKLVEGTLDNSAIKFSWATHKSGDTTLPVEGHFQAIYSLQGFKPDRPNGWAVYPLTIWGDKVTYQISNFRIYESNEKSYKSNILTVNEDVTLRGVGDVKDELDLMTGKYVQRIGKTTITGDLIPTVTSWERNNNSETMCFESFGGIIPFQWNQIISADWPITWEEFNPSLTHEYFNPHGGHGIFRIKRSRLETEDANGFKKWLNENPITIYHPVIGSESIKTVDLTSTYFFKPINKDSIQVTGTVTPLVGSVTVPTNPILFTLDPNQEVGQQFIAPEFGVVNETNAPIRLSLNRFEQTTTVLKDVLPDKYSRWEGLNKQESKDIALALVPKAGNGWVSLIEGPRYVAETSNTELGVIKAKSSVDFTFSALHGQAFEEVLNPSYRLGFVFEFMN